MVWGSGVYLWAHKSPLSTNISREWSQPFTHYEVHVFARELCPSESSPPYVEFGHTSGPETTPMGVTRYHRYSAAGTGFVINARIKENMCVFNSRIAGSILCQAITQATKSSATGATLPVLFRDHYCSTIIHAYSARGRRWRRHNEGDDGRELVETLERKGHREKEDGNPQQKKPQNTRRQNGSNKKPQKKNQLHVYIRKHNKSGL